MPFVWAKESWLHGQSASNTPHEIQRPNGLTAVGTLSEESRSEGKASRQLDLTVGVELRSFNLTEGSVVKTGVRVGEFRCVEEVEGIPVQFQGVLVGQMDVLLQAEIDFLESRSKDLIAVQGSQASEYCAAAAVYPSGFRRIGK